MKAMHLAIVGGLMVTAGLVGIYSLAATAATTLASTLTTEETGRHARSVEFAATLEHASEKQRRENFNP